MPELPEDLTKMSRVLLHWPPEDVENLARSLLSETDLKWLAAKPGIQAVYEQFKHLDRLLSDTQWWGDNIKYNIIHNLWMAVKAAVGEEKSDEGNP